MADCRVCNAPIRWAQDAEGNAIPLDAHEERDYGPGRYRIVEDGTRPIVAAIAEESPARTYFDHRVVCGEGRPI